MTYSEALDYIHSNFWQGSKPGLSRTEELLNKIGNPQDSLRFVHVAGTNGKGSFCAMLSSILLECGMKVGTYTSPYILRFNERMKVNGNDIPDQVLADLTDYIRPYAESMEEKPTEFELITAIAMEYFKRENCDVVVLECGMGGRLDSTNVIKTPLLSVITGIALDHTAFLGDTVKAIATEKAGIIKEGVPVLYCGKDAEAKQVIEEKANKMHSPLHLMDRSGLIIHSASLEGTRFDWNGFQSMHLPLLGSYQPENAQNVLKAVALLRECGFSLPDEKVRKGLEKVRWPARYEIVRKSPLILCDGGHNPEGVEAAVNSTKLYFGKEKVLVVTGVMADKDHKYMVSRISEIADEVFCLTPANPRALNAQKLAEEFRDFGVSASPFATPLDAVRAAVTKAKNENKAILCVGSLYMYGEVMEALTTLCI